MLLRNITTNLANNDNFSKNQNGFKTSCNTVFNKKQASFYFKDLTMHNPFNSSKYPGFKSLFGFKKKKY